MNNILIVYALRPLDPTNILVQKTVTNLVGWLKEKGIEYDILGGYLLHRPTFSYLSPSFLQQTNLVVFVSHGLPDSICGSSYLAENISSLGIITKDNENLLKHKVVVSLTCYSLRELGNQTKAFIGFKERLLGQEIADLDEDMENDFIDCFAVPVKMLLMGSSVEEAVKHFHDACKYYMGIAESKGLTDTEYYTCMSRNYEAIGYKGDGWAKISYF